MISSRLPQISRASPSDGCQGRGVLIAVCDEGWRSGLLEGPVGFEPMTPGLKGAKAFMTGSQSRLGTNPPILNRRAI